MDFLVYLLVVLVLGVSRMYSTKDISDSVGITSESMTDQNVEMTINEDLPVADNLQLKKEPHAFHYILLGLGLEQ